MAAKVRFEIENAAAAAGREDGSPPPRHGYALRSRSSRVAGAWGAAKRKGSAGVTPKLKLRRRSKVKRGVCGDLKVASTRKRITLK